VAEVETVAGVGAGSTDADPVATGARDVDPPDPPVVGVGAEIAVGRPEPFADVAADLRGGATSQRLDREPQRRGDLRFFFERVLEDPLERRGRELQDLGAGNVELPVPGRIAGGVEDVGVDDPIRPGRPASMRLMDIRMIGRKSTAGAGSQFARRAAASLRAHPRPRARAH
jgi:hypothetical protein